MFSLHHSMPTDSPVVGYTARDTVWNLVRRAALGSWSHYCWTRALLDALGYPHQQMGFSHTSPMATQVLQHRCDQWASADAEIVRQDSHRASRPQAILKFHPLSSLNYKARHRPQTPEGKINRQTFLRKYSLRYFISFFLNYSALEWMMARTEPIGYRQPRVERSHNSVSRTSSNEFMNVLILAFLWLCYIQYWRMKYYWKNIQIKSYFQYFHFFLWSK